MRARRELGKQVRSDDLVVGRTYLLRDFQVRRLGANAGSFIRPASVVSRDGVLN